MKPMEYNESELNEMITFEQKCRMEIEEAYSSVNTKRQLFRDRLRLYIDNGKNNEKVSSNTIYSTMQVAMAVSYSDEVSAIFVPKGMGDEERAENLNSVARHDNSDEDLGYNMLKFQSDWDRLFFGVSLRAHDGFNAECLAPQFRVLDPLSWLPDPHSDFYTKARYEWFEMSVNRAEMTEENGWEPNAQELAKGSQIADLSTTETARQEASLLQTSDDKQQQFADIYFGFTREGDEVYLVAMSCGYKVLKKLQIDFKDIPVARTYFSPLRGDPFGVSLVDLIEDKQRANSILMNLRLINAKFNTYGQMNMYDSKIVKNVDQLRSPSTNPKWIPVDTTFGPIQNAIYPVPRQQIAQDSWNVSQEISRQIQLDTGFDSRTLGTQGDKVITLGESQQIQANANIRFALNFEISAWGEKKFWSIWYQSYKNNLNKSKRKYVRISSGFALRAIELTAKDFILGKDPIVYIESRKNVEAMREKERAALSSHLPFILQDPTLSLYAKRHMLKKSLKLSGMSQEDVNVIDKTYEERDAEEMLPLLDNDDASGAEIDKMDVDHSVYIAVFERALDTDAKFAAIEARKMAMLASNQFKKDTNGVAQSAANAASAQLQSASMKNSKTGPASLADIQA